MTVHEQDKTPANGPDFTEYDKRMEDLDYRRLLERAALTPEEEEEMYTGLDAIFAEPEHTEIRRDRRIWAPSTCATSSRRVKRKRRRR